MTLIAITQEQLSEYRAVQDAGAHNMLDPRARALTTLNRTEWMEIIENYDELIELYPDSEENESELRSHIENEANCCDLCEEPIMDCICEHNGSEEWANSEPYDSSREYDC